MECPLVAAQAPTEFFKELVDSALARQHLRARDLTASYIVDLLCRFVRADGREFGSESEPMAFRLIRAVESGGLEQRARLRDLGDFALFVTGFFPDSLNRRAVDVDYYVSMGEYAYGSLSRRDPDSFADVFRDLARNFVGFTDVLADVSERTSRNQQADLLRLYERWLRTGSDRDGRRMVELGVLPNESIGRRFIQ